MPVETSIKIRRGEDIVIEMTMKTPPVGGVTGWTTQLTIREKQNVSSDLIYQVAGVIIDAALGVFEFAIPNEAAGTLVAPNIYYYDIRRTNTGAEKTLAVGPFEVKWSVGI